MPILSAWHAMARPRLLRLCLVDMNNGVPNQAIRCFYRILRRFVRRVRDENPDLEM